MIDRRQFVLGSAAAAALVAAGCSTPPTSPVNTPETPRLDPSRHQLITRTPPADGVLPPGPEGALVASRALLAAATIVGIVAPDADATGPAEIARALGVPLLVNSPELPAELNRLQTRTVLSWVENLDVGEREVIGAPTSADALSLDGLPLAPPANDVLVLAAEEPSDVVGATLSAAGLEPTRTPGPLPGGDAATTALVRSHDGRVLGVGAALGTDADYAAQVTVTRSAAELPGGGIAPLPGHHMIALYGHPETAALGMLGEQSPAASVERVQRLVDAYADLVIDVTFMGAFEIIATVASSGAGDRGDYSYRTPADKLLPWLDAAEAAGLYVVLDLQPGRTDFLTQAQEYADLLARPHVGLALDPEWRLKPDGRHLRSIGQVHVDEVNAVGNWLADFITEHRLPPKVLTLHQFQTRMIVERDRLDTTRPQVQYLVHVDGQGSQPAKQGTWEVIKRDLPERSWLGWKNFEDEDTPMLTPAQTVAQVDPLPHFISYQ